MFSAKLLPVLLANKAAQVDNFKISYYNSFRF